MTTNGVYKFECKAGTYESDTLIGLLWERFRHKLWHLRKMEGGLIEKNKL